MFRKLLAYKLRVIATLVLKKYKPKIVAITGSVGKSTTKEAVFEVLRHKFFVWKSEKNLNTEIGVPISVLGIAKEPGRSVVRWLGIIFRGLGFIFFKRKYPEILVLEMGAQFPGDLEHLTSFIKPDISVITNIGISHLEYLKTPEAIRYEKGALVRALSPDGTAILNKDDEGAMSLAGDCKGRVITFGLNSQADFDLTKLSLDGSWPKPKTYAALAAAAVASVFDISASEVERAINNFKGLPGRLQKKEGINDITIIDDTYNSAPASAVAALETLKNFPGNRKIAVFGRMAELGDATIPCHKEVGKVASSMRIDLLLVKNNDAKYIAEGAIENGLEALKIIEFSSAEEAVKLLKENIGAGDVVLVKASRADRFEEIVNGIAKS